MIIIVLIGYLAIALTVFKGAIVMRDKQPRTLEPDPYPPPGGFRWHYSDEKWKRRKFWKWISQAALLWPLPLLGVPIFFLYTWVYNEIMDMYNGTSETLKPRNSAEWEQLQSKYRELETILYAAIEADNKATIESLRGQMSGLEGLGATPGQRVGQK